MVGRYRAARTDAWDAAECFLALLGIDEPTTDQHAGALVLGEFVTNINRFFGGKG